jgi:hypothetical protein
LICGKPDTPFARISSDTIRKQANGVSVISFLKADAGLKLQKSLGGVGLR